MKKENTKEIDEDEIQKFFNRGNKMIKEDEEGKDIETQLSRNN